MQTGLETYDINSYSMTFTPNSSALATVPPILFSGLAPGTAITVEQSADDFTIEVGMDGTTSRTRNRNLFYTVSVVLKQTSLTNTELDALAKYDRSSNNGYGTLKVTQTATGVDVFTGNFAFLTKVPTQEFGDASGTRSWSFVSGLSSSVSGGAGSGGTVTP